MKLFYQLSEEQQDSAIQHCVDLVSNNALENGLHIEEYAEEDASGLKQHISSLMDELREHTELTTAEEKLNFLLSDETFEETIMDLAQEMASNAFYHDNDELVIFTDTLDNQQPHEDCEECSTEHNHDQEPQTVDELVGKNKWNLN